MVKLLMSIVLMMTFGSSFLFGADTDAQKLYGTKCSKCHGLDGTGSAKMAKMFKVDNSKLDLTGDTVVNAKDADLAAITTNGQKKMPSFKDKLKAEDIQALIQYIRTLATPKK